MAMMNRDRVDEKTEMKQKKNVMIWKRKSLKVKIDEKGKELEGN